MSGLSPSGAPAASSAPSAAQPGPAVGRPAPRGRASLVGGYVVALLLGAVVGTVGTVAHRLWAPGVLVLALLAVLAAGVMVRAWIGTGGLLAYGLGWLVIVQLAATAGPGGDVLLPGQAISYVWMGGGMLMVGVAAFAPRHWFTD